MVSPRRVTAFAAVLVAVACGGCEDSPAGPQYDPEIPTAWATAVDNQFLPLLPGTTLEYLADTDEGVERTLVEILDETRVINGVAARVVRDRVYLDGELIEDTYDWFAQDSDGNVWYLGEDSKEVENGTVVSTEGSWEWGVDGALPGILMWADPAAHTGESYRQEFYEGEAEDYGRVVDQGHAVSVPWDDYTGCVRIEEWNALEPGSREHKYFCPGVGMVLEAEPATGDRGAELVSITD